MFAIVGLVLLVMWLAGFFPFMRGERWRILFLATAACVCGLGVSAQQHNIDTQKSTITIHVGKTGAFSALGHEHEVRAPIHSGTADTGSHPAVEVHVDARELRVVGQDEPRKIASTCRRR